MAQSSSPMRILIIDDDEMSRDLLAVLLEAEGYAVASADSGDAALALLDATQPRPSVVLTDMQMPGSSPTQLAGRLRRACGRNTLLLAMSGSRPAPATLARYDGFLLKPFSAAELAPLIASLHSAHTPTRVQKTISPAPAPAKSARTAKKSPTKKPATTLALAASAEEPASKHRMDSAFHATAPPPGSAPILDETIYGQLAGSMPAPQLREMYSMCLTDARTRIASMRQLATQHDDTQFMRQAHTIKGSCGMLGATELHRMATTLETLGPGTGDAAVNSLDELSAACDRLERMLGARA